MRNSRESSLKKKRFKDIEIMEEKEIMISSVSLKLLVLHAGLSLFLIIYPYKLPGLTFYLSFQLEICESALDNGVKSDQSYPIIMSRFTYLK